MQDIIFEYEEVPWKRLRQVLEVLRRFACRRKLGEANKGRHGGPVLKPLLWVSTAGGFIDS